MDYCVIRQYTGNPNDLPVILHHINDTLVPRIREIDGFRLYSLAEGLDAEVDQFAVVSVFDSEAAADASLRIAAAWLAEHKANFTLSAPEVTSGEVKIRETKIGQEPTIGVMRFLRGKLADAQEVEWRVASSLVPLLRDQPGLVSFMMIDSGGGTAVLLFTYADRHAAEAGGKLGINWMKETLADMLPQQFAATLGEFKLRISLEAPVAT